MSIKKSEIGYVRIKRYDLYNTACVPTGNVREVDGEKEAEFFLISGNNPERKIWIKRNEIY